MKTLMLAAILCLMAWPVMAQDFDSLDKSQPAPQASKPAPGNCGDDPRLETDIVEIMQSDAPVKPAITVTPETYLTLDSEVLQRLAGQMVICPNNPLLKSGKPAKRVEIDFEPLWQSIQTAATKGDMEAVKNYFTGFTAKPKSTEEILNMLTKIPLDDKTLQNLYKTAGIQWDKQHKWQPDLVDIYTRLGGRPADTVVVVYGFHDVKNQDEYREKFKNVAFLHDVNGDKEPWPRKLSALGIKTVKN